MKKIFVYSPVKGRTNTEIAKTSEKLLWIAKAIFGDFERVYGPTASELEKMRQGIVTEYKDIDLWNLGWFALCMAQADYFIGVEIRDVWDEFTCEVARFATMDGNDRSILIDGRYVMDDYEEYVTKLRQAQDAKANAKSPTVALL